MLSILFLVFTSPVLLSQQGSSDNFRALLTVPERQKYDGASDFQGRIQVLYGAFDRYVLITKKELGNEDIYKAEVAVRSIQILALKGIEITKQITSKKVLRSRILRKTEIRLRKLLVELENLKRLSPLSLWEVFDKTIEKVKAFRDELIEGFFAFVVSSSLSLSVWGSPSDFYSRKVQSFVPVSTEMGHQSKIRHFMSGDQFTAIEHEKLREAQKLRRRVKVFLKIAEARLDEIERRISAEKWRKERKNPLEFYTYAQLVRAYNRSIEGIMINIDEKVNSNVETEENIKKSLLQFKSKMPSFVRRLEPVKKFSEYQNDRDLYLEWGKAWESSQMALKGSKLGLKKLKQR